MKNPLDPRHKRREKIIKDLFGLSFQKTNGSQDKIVAKILKNQKKIDDIISIAAPEWPVQQINRLDLAILRLAIFELVIEAKEPLKVIIDEAIELAKTYGEEKSPTFINGALGAVLKNLKNEKS